MKPSSSSSSGRRLLRAGAAAVLVAVSAAALATGCLDRPVSKQQPNTTNIIVDQIVQNAVNKIDLLFMIDNSISMADKQAILRDAVPPMLTRLLVPLCEQEGSDVLVPRDAAGACPAGTSPEFEPIADIHIGVVTSSIGGHGGVLCSADVGDKWDPSQNDNAMLLGTPGLRAAVPSFQNQGFLKWDREAKAGGTTDQGVLISEFSTMIQATGELGCGYEASLESWYRFLLDPQPPAQVVKNPQGVTEPVGINEALLLQRAQFLRPDSLVAIVMLSDENDCSIRDDGVSWLVGDQTKRLPRATSACAQDPNSPCCRSCALIEAAPPPNCGPISSDPECAKGAFATNEEQLNLRCYDQKKRFGIDFLYPTGRYVDALKQPVVYGRPCVDNNGCPPIGTWGTPGTCKKFDNGAQACEYISPLRAANPLYSDLQPRVDDGLVFLAGIVGVPWQDIATDATRDLPDELEYVRANVAVGGAKTLNDLWPVILGDPNAGVPPSDPYMIESIDPRTAALPGPLGIPLQPPNAPAGASPVNGHEYTITQRDDLQYACIFPLAVEDQKDCVEGFIGGCDCKQSVGGPPDRPLCQAPGTTTSGIHQYYAKAYPGLRFLQVLKDYGQNSIVASVCPKISDKTKQAFSGYGYNPAVKAIIDRLKEKLRGACLPRPIALREDDTIACELVEVTQVVPAIQCSGPGRAPIDPEIEKVVRKEMKKAGRCGAAGQAACEQLTLCALLPTLPGTPEHDVCLNLTDEQLAAAANPQPFAGYCYVDPAQGLGNPALVADCEPSQRRLLRTISNEVRPKVPFETSTLFYACQGAAL